MITTDPQKLPRISVPPIATNLCTFRSQTMAAAAPEAVFAAQQQTFLMQPKKQERAPQKQSVAHDKMLPKHPPMHVKSPIRIWIDSPGFSALFPVWIPCLDRQSWFP